VTSVHPVIAATLAHSIERSIYDVSRILLYPVLIAALFCLGWAIVEVGWFLYELYLRVRYRDLEALEIRTLKARDAFAKGQPRRAYKYLQESNYSTVVARFLFDLIRNYQTERIAEKPLKLLQEYEFYTVKRLEKTRILVRIGPMLGLMGTLIPLAPALAGLASGNTAILAANLEIAFSVTVIGLLIGGLGFIVSIVRDRFYQQDISDLEYMLELLEGGGGRLRLGPPRRQLADYDTAADDLPDLTIMPLVSAQATPNGGGAPTATPVAAPFAPVAATAPVAAGAAPIRAQAGPHDGPGEGAVVSDEADEPTEIISWRPLAAREASLPDEALSDAPPPAPLSSDDGPA
jgi:biopolymer transport protein ExbB/TolQ